MSPVIAQKEKLPIVGPRDYGYPNARLRGMRSRLLKAEAFEHLIATGGMHQLIQELMRTEYASDLEEVLIHGRGAAEVSDALQRHLIRIHEKVFGFLNQEAKDICATMLGRWDVFNIKTILRGKLYGLGSAEISGNLMPVGALGSVDLAGLLAQSDVSGVIDTASTWELPQAPALRDGYEKYQATGNFVDVELALDRYYAGWAGSRLARRNSNYAMIRKLLCAQIDILNTVTAFRASRDRLSLEAAKEYFLSGGDGISVSLFGQLVAASDAGGLLEALRSTPFSAALEGVASQYAEDPSIVVFERALEDYFTRKMVALSSTDSLGVGIPLAYLWGKQNEVTNIRIITKAKEVGIPLERTRRELILV
ncbi:MAG: V-type ATPase subunit [Coriobacteriia bacterium]|nr:V-type ATPase subunit [Coriobacteriia bacterium]